jgi:hypothetical protein
MTDLEERLRDELARVADRAQPGSIRPLRIPDDRLRHRAIRRLAPVLAAAAVAGVVTAASLISPTGPRPPVRAAAGLPKYYVTLNDSMHGRTPVVTATVRVSATGVTLAAVPLLSGQPGEVNEVYGVSAWISGAASDRFFVIGVNNVSGVNEDLYALRLAPDGRPDRLRQYPAAIARQVHPPGVLSPDGTQLADAAFACTKRYCRNGVKVISLATGAHRTWLARGSPYWTAPLSWTSSGQIFFWHRSRAALVYRLLNTTGNGGELLADSSPVASPRDQRGWQPNGPAMLTADGRAVISSDFRSPTGGKGTTVIPGYGPAYLSARILELSPRTGRLLRVLHVATEPESADFGPGCYAASVAPTGLRALIQCGTFGRLDGGHFTPLPGGLSVTWPPADSSHDDAISLGQGIPETAAW